MGKFPCISADLKDNDLLFNVALVLVLEHGIFRKKIRKSSAISARLATDVKGDTTMVSRSGLDLDTRILVYHPTGAKSLCDYLAKLGVKSVWSASTAREVEVFWAQFDVLLGWDIPSPLLHSPGLRWVQMTGAGVDQLFREPEVLPPDLLVTRIVDQFGVSIAEYVFAYVLYLTKQIDDLRKAQLKSAWQSLHLDTLAGKTIGVAGLGSIGLEVVRKARAFDMRVHGLSRTGEHAQSVDKHYFAHDWLEFVRDLDVLVIALPLTPDTRGVLSAAILEAMDDKCILVNIGRGPIIEETALMAALERRPLLRVVLDVFATEPLPPEHPFWSMPNVCVTPHLSGPSQTQRVAEFFVDNLRRYQQGQSLWGSVDLTRAY
jgi:glyoxylate/hydroxypyruvate reductase A